jgi:hypothetical protein
LDLGQAVSHDCVMGANWKMCECQWCWPMDLEGSLARSGCGAECDGASCGCFAGRQRFEIWCGSFSNCCKWLIAFRIGVGEFKTMFAQHFLSLKLRPLFRTGAELRIQTETRSNFTKTIQKEFELDFTA